MRISTPHIIQEDRKITYRVGVETAQGRDTLWYSLQASFGDLLADSADAPLVALLIPAMAMGEDIHIEGVISESLFWRLSGPFQRLLRYMIPSLHPVQIYPGTVCDDPPPSAAGVATGFSGGIDSFCVLADYFFADIPERHKVTHLLFNNVGSHGRGGERLFRERYERLLPAAERMGLPFLRINSNLNAFYEKTTGFQKTHTLRNASVAFLLQGGVGRYLYASTFDFSDVFVGPTYDMAYGDLITLPILSTDALNLCSVGSEYTRVQKTLRVAEQPDSYGTLDVCVNARNTSGYTNCATCWKCLRTLATLEIAGCLERYSASFDLKAYTRRRKAYLATLLGSHDPLQSEIVEFARDRHYAFPIASRLLHYSGVYPIKNASTLALRKLKHRMRRSQS